MAPFNPPLAPTEIAAAFGGNYAAITPLQSGGQGCVYRAETTAGAAHAIKIYFPNPVAQVEERTDREVAALGSIQAETVVRLHDYGDIAIRGQQCRFVTTTFIDGRVL